MCLQKQRDVIQACQTQNRPKATWSHLSCQYDRIRVRYSNLICVLLSNNFVTSETCNGFVKFKTTEQETTCTYSFIAIRKCTYVQLYELYKLLCLCGPQMCLQRAACCYAWCNRHFCENYISTYSIWNVYLKVW